MKPDDIDRRVTEECTPVGFIMWSETPDLLIRGVPYFSGLQKMEEDGWRIVASPLGADSPEEDWLLYVGPIPICFCLNKRPI